jgi:two-component system, NarL family, sensor histidine kinase UhpB
MMSLRGQFFLSVIVALLLGLSALGVIACWHARRSVENEMRMALEASDRIVDNALLSLPERDRRAYLARLVDSFDGNRHVRVSLMEGGRPVAVSRLAPPEEVPGWFTTLLEIPPEQRLDYAPRLGGRMLVVATDPHNEISEAWVQARDGALILSGFSLLVLGLLHLAMARTGAPLRKLGAGFDAVGGGDYAARVPPQGPREIAHLANAFNRMAERLGGLEAANRRLARQLSAIQEEERADLARDLHDEMGPFLFAMRVDAESIAGMAGKGAIAERAHAISEAVSHIQAHVRAILKQLRPAGLVDVGLAQAIANLATFWQRHHDGIAIRLDIDAARPGFGAEADAAIYRLVQESLTNAARHGGAKQVAIAIASDAASISVMVEDDGSGLVAGGSDGMGLKGMRERLAALGGTLQLGNRAGGGARLQAVIPRAEREIDAVAAQ